MDFVLLMILHPKTQLVRQRQAGWSGLGGIGLGVGAKARVYYDYSDKGVD